MILWNGVDGVFLNFESPCLVDEKEEENKRMRIFEYFRGLINVQFC